MLDCGDKLLSFSRPGTLQIEKIRLLDRILLNLSASNIYKNGHIYIEGKSGMPGFSGTFDKHGKQTLYEAGDITEQTLKWWH
jgi:hypothetical protein